MCNYANVREISGNINVPIFRPGCNLVRAFPRENWEPEMHKFERVKVVRVLRKFSNYDYLSIPFYSSKLKQESSILFF